MSMIFSYLMFLYFLVFIGFQIGQRIGMTKIKTTTFLIITILIWFIIKNYDTL
jgi:hypothetical protein